MDGNNNGRNISAAKRRHANDSGQALINVSTVGGRDLTADGLALAELQAGMLGLTGKFQLSLDIAILNAWEIARINGLGPHAMINTYIDNFVDDVGILTVSTNGFHHKPDLDVMRNSINETTLSNSAAWTGSGTFSHSGANISNGGSNGAIRTIHPVSGDFDFRFTMAGVTNDRTWRMGLFPASELSNFSSSGQLGGLPTAYGGSNATSIENGIGFYAYSAYVDTVEIIENAIQDGTRSSSGAFNGQVFRLSRRGNHFHAYRNDILFDMFNFTSNENVYFVLGSDTSTEQYNSVNWTTYSEELAGQVVCTPITSAAPPTELRILADIESADTLEENTDIVIAASRDGGGSWTTGVITKLAVPLPNRVIFGTIIDVSEQPAGTEILIRLSVQESHDVMLHRWAVQADQSLSI